MTCALLAAAYWNLPPAKSSIKYRKTGGREAKLDLGGVGR